MCLLVWQIKVLKEGLDGVTTLISGTLTGAVVSQTMLMVVIKIAFKSNPTLAAGMMLNVIKPITSFAKYHNSKDDDNGEKCYLGQIVLQVIIIFEKSLNSIFVIIFFVIFSQNEKEKKVWMTVQNNEIYVAFSFRKKFSPIDVRLIRNTLRLHGQGALLRFSREWWFFMRLISWNILTIF